MNARLLFCMAVLAPALSNAGTIQAEASVGVGRSDNIDRNTENERSGTMETAGLRFSAMQESRRVNADVVGDLAWIRFAGSSYSSNFSGTARGRVVLNVIEEHLQWNVEDNFQQTRRDQFAVPTPQNNENVNYFSTGPDLRLSLGRILDFAAGGRFALVDYEASPADTRRYDASVSIEHEFPDASRVSANVTNAWITPHQSAAFPAYERSTVFARYAVSGAHTSLRLDAGSNRVTVDNGSVTDLLVRAQIDRQFGEYAHFSLRIGREYTDSGNTLVLAPGALEVPGQQADSLVQVAQPFRSQFASAGWYIAGTRTTVQLYGGWYDEHYLYTEVLDRQRMQAGFKLSRLFAERMHVMAGIDLNRDHYEVFYPDNSNLTARLGGTWSPISKTTVQLSVERSFYATEVASADVNETRYWLRASYGIAPDRPPGFQ